MPHAHSPPSAPPSKRLRVCDDEPSPPLFVWKKKVEQQRRHGHTPTPADLVQHQQHLQEELLAAKARRAARDKERAARDVEIAAEAREKEAACNGDFVEKEAQFEASQHFLRQRIRQKEGRGNIVDEVSRLIRPDLQAVPDINDTLKSIVGKGEPLLTLVDQEIAFADAFPEEGEKGHNRRLRFWQCVREICVGGSEERGEGIEERVVEVLKGVEGEQLREMRGEIERGLREGEDAFEDDEFWATVLKRIGVLLAEECVKEIALEVAAEQGKRAEGVGRPERPKKAERRENTCYEEDFKEKDEDVVAGQDEEMMRREAAKGFAEDEENFCDEVTAMRRETKQHVTAGYSWNDKYRPRKPRYFNRVHTGYNWTKYNRTHYDHDNPPPKTVKGYKFNIFYPDLIDPSCTPNFFTTDTDNPEVSIITFQAGPPYEDLAFKIVNRPWERSHRRGFRCAFDRGILHVWFNFERYRYRR